MNLALASLRSRFFSLSPRRSLGLALLVVLAGGCKQRLYDFGGVLKPIDAGASDSTGTQPFEVTPLPDSGPDVTGVAGSGGASGAAGGHAGTGGAGGSIVLCDPASPDRMTDPFNCGTCLNNCTAP